MPQNNLPPEVEYDFVGGVEDDGSPALLAVKRWREGGAEREQRLTVTSYGSAAQLDVDLRELDEVRDGFGLQTAMNLAESIAVASGTLHDGRDDARLFTDGPPDPFTTNAERQRTAEAFIREYSERDTEELPRAPERVSLLDEADIAQPAPDSWDELLAAQSDEEPVREAHYWQMHTLPVETPDGEPLGMALFVTEFPGLPPDYDGDLPDAVTGRALEMAHFGSDDDARRFETEFRSYLVPGLLDGPELAPEVAKLEGLSGEWQDMDGDEIVATMSGRRTVIREESEWRLHNPNAEREAREQFECPSDDIDL
jgi:hypothetical protein